MKHWYAGYPCQFLLPGFIYDPKVTRQFIKVTRHFGVLQVLIVVSSLGVYILD
jgi:hypothetical protein